LGWAQYDDIHDNGLVVEIIDFGLLLSFAPFCLLLGLFLGSLSLLLFLQSTGIFIVLLLPKDNVLLALEPPALGHSLECIFPGGPPSNKGIKPS
jgi:hypothetical protein